MQTSSLPHLVCGSLRKTWFLRIFTLGLWSSFLSNFRWIEILRLSSVASINIRQEPGTKTGRNLGNAAKRAPTIEPPPPTNLQTKESAQRNESIISESIFGVEVSVVEIAPRQSFAANYAKVVDVAAEVYDGYRADEKQLERVLVHEEISYYATAMLHLKLLEVKAKQGERVLRSAEKDLRKATADDIFNIPQPLFAYLSEIGVYCDKMGKETRLDVPDLPIAVAQGFGGYHANRIDEDSHNLFEEVPSLGIAGDMLMAVASAAAEPIPNFHVGLPLNSTVTSNLVGKFYPAPPPYVTSCVNCHYLM
ncbi:hypothetical protein ABEB36_014131 [Hypothenemus hampei]|uniref:Uncharacterized protein n=1 Tax=Hypothenemus hampei TaxID=57062 RepID=A0ABD1E3E4_HYPHA